MFVYRAKHIYINAPFYTSVSQNLNHKTSRMGSLSTDQHRFPDGIFLTTALERSVKIIFRRKIGEAGSHTELWWIIF